MLLEKGVDTAEYTVGGLVAAAMVPPPFDDTLVVPEDLEDWGWGSKADDGDDEKFETNGFCPTDVTTGHLPTGE